jgi:hypothetical protein
MPRGINSGLNAKVGLIQETKTREKLNGLHYLSAGPVKFLVAGLRMRNRDPPLGCLVDHGQYHQTGFDRL